eukprot:PhM_4_TR3756/c0_g1_i2/m.4631
MVRGEAKLFIGQIPSSMTQGEIYRLFAAYGDILDVHVLCDGWGCPRGAAFVTYTTTEEADTAIAALHDRYRMLPTRCMQVSYAKNSPNISPYGHHVAVDVAVRNGSNPMPGAVPSQPSTEHHWGTTAHIPSVSNWMGYPSQHPHHRHQPHPYSSVQTTTTYFSCGSDESQSSHAGGVAKEHDEGTSSASWCPSSASCTVSPSACPATTVGEDPTSPLSSIVTTENPFASAAGTLPSTTPGCM